MNNTDTKLRIASVLLLGTMTIGVVMNTCAIDRIEKQVIRMSKAIEKGGVGLSPNSAAPAGTASSDHTPGANSPVEAVGWNGTRAKVQYVEGALPNAPLLLSQKPKPQNDTYIQRRSSPPGSLNYYATNEGETETITRYILGRLIENDKDAPQNIVPNLAIRWEISDDKLTYTFHLRRGVQFADGRPFTSADVKFTFDVLRDPAVNAEHIRSSFDDVESLETPDPYKVVVKYRKKYWKGIYTVGYNMRILNKGWYEEEIPNFAKNLGISTFNTSPGKPGFGDVFNKMRLPCPGTGPYYFEAPDYDQNKPMNLEQNPFYFGIQSEPNNWNFAKLRWLFISDEVAAFEEFRKQNFDISVVDFQPYDDEYIKDPLITSISNYFEYDHTGLAYSYIAWNARKPPFDDPRVRRAMTHLTNRQWILDEIERGRGTIAVCPSKRIYPSYSNDLTPHPFDIEAARKLLAEAGWTDTNGDGVLDKDGKPFEFEFKVGSPRRFYLQVGAVLQDACKKVGIRMNARTLEWSTFITDFYERRFDAVCLYSSFQDPWIDQYDEFHSSQDVPRGGNSCGWRNARADTLLEQMREEFDDGKRNAMFAEFNKIFYEEQPMTLLIHGVVGVLMHNRFENVKVRPTGMQFFDFWVGPPKVLHK